MKTLVPCLLLALLGALSLGQVPADLVLINGKIWTVNPARPQAEAVACSGGLITAVGTTAQILPLAGKGTRVVDLHGRLALPGFNDAHVHLIDGGAHLAGVQLRDAMTEEELRERIRRFAMTLKPGRWITGGDWDHQNWTPARLPTRHLIDGATAENPVFINRLDGHMCLANTLALKAAGITKETPDPPGGQSCGTRRVSRQESSKTRRWIRCTRLFPT